MARIGSVLARVGTGHRTALPTSLTGRDRGSNRRGSSRLILSGSIRLLALLCLAALLAIRVWDPLPVEVLRLQSFDLYQRLKPRLPTSRPVVIVDIDEESLGEVGQWPWPRTVMADLLLGLFRMGAPVVGFDLVFGEPDRLSPAVLSKTVRGLTPDIVKSLRGLPSNDDVLARAVQQTRVVLGQAVVTRKVESLASVPVIKTPAALVGGDPRPYLPAFGFVVRNLANLERAALGRGVFGIAAERDNVVRRIPAAIRVGDDIYPSLVIEMLRVGTGQKTYAIKLNEAGIESVVVGGIKIPTDSNGRIWVHFAPRDTNRYVSAKDVLQGKVPNERIAGKLVLIGTSAAGLRDIKATPIGIGMPGVDIHAQLLETILSGSHLARPNYALGAEFSLVFVTGLLIIVLVPMLGALWTFFIGSAISATLVAGSWYLFVNDRLLIDVSYTAVASLGLFSLLVFTNYAREQVERQQIRRAFSRYLSPDVVSRLADDPKQLKLGGEHREMTLLFSDVVGFTTISEKFDAERLTKLVNRILTPLTNAVLETGGTIDKYMGDSIMAFWNAPVDDPKHARNACHAALKMRREIEPLNDTLRAESEAEGRSHPPIDVGIGLNTGECCVGNLGSDARFDYSVLGDTVNLASRLEGQTRTYKVGIVVGESTYQQATDLAFLELDLIKVIGKTVPVRIYALVGDEALAVSKEFRELAGAHEMMLSTYRAQDWGATESAIQHCRRLGRRLDLEGMYGVYEDRVTKLAENPPGLNWDTVFVATSKH